MGGWRVAPQQTGWGSTLHRGLELTLSDLLAGWQEAVAYKGTESRNIAGESFSHDLGWSTSGQRPPLLLPRIPLGTRVSNS